MWTGLLTLVIRPSVWDTAQALAPVHCPSHFVSLLPPCRMTGVSPSVLIFLIFCFLWGTGFNLVQSTSTLDTFRSLEKRNHEYSVYSFPLSQLLFSAFFSCSINTSLFLTTADQPGFVFCTMPAFGAEKQQCLNSWHSSRTAPELPCTEVTHLMGWQTVPCCPEREQLWLHSCSECSCTLPAHPMAFASMPSHFFTQQALSYKLHMQGRPSLPIDLSFAHSIENMESDLQSIFPTLHLISLQVLIFPSRQNPTETELNLWEKEHQYKALSEVSANKTIYGVSVSQAKIKFFPIKSTVFIK